jgi:multicomponent Na+:H+ antiporter subunit D
MTALVLIPLALAVAGFALGPRIAPRLAWPGSAAMLAVAAALVYDVWSAGPQRVALGGWAAPLGIELYADGLAAAMIAATALVAALVSVHARDFFRLEEGGERFWPLWSLLWAAMNAVYLATDVFNAYVALELLGLSAVGLVAVGAKAAALAATLRYLLAAIFGSLLYLMGVALVYGTHGTLAMEALARLLVPGPVVSLALALMAAGLLLKTALFPLHSWLPPAHGTAAAPVSALLSGLVVKTSFYLLLRLWFDVFGEVSGAAAAQLLGVFGAAAVLWGAFAALRQARLKMLVAYSTVAQVGYLFLLFPLAAAAPVEAASQAWTGGVLYALSHAFAKAAMFLAAGSIVHAWGEDDIEHLEGTSARLPWSLFAFALAGVTLMGLPPSGGFLGKWLLLRSAFGSGQWWWAAVILVGGLMTAVYVFRVLRSAFVPPLPSRALHPVSRAMEVTALLLALLGIAIGLAGAAPAALLAVGRMMPGLP